MTTVMTKERAVEFFSEFYFGEHHIPGKLQEWGTGWALLADHDLATFDFNQLTRLVVMAHDECIRVSIVPASAKRYRLCINPRTRGDRLYTNHPFLEDHITSIRNKRPGRQPIEKDMTLLEYEALKRRVASEAALLSQHTTAEEKARLSWESVISWQSQRSIYGLLTGDDNGARTFQLLQLCGNPFSWDQHKFKPASVAWSEKDRHIRPVSALEFYTCLGEGLDMGVSPNIIQLVGMIKGEEDFDPVVL